MTPFTYTDPDGDRLGVSQCGNGVHLLITPDGEDTGGFAACVRPGDVPRIAAEMHKAAGLPGRWAELKRYLEGIRAKAAGNAADAALPERARFEMETQAKSMEFVLTAMAAMEASGQ